MATVALRQVGSISLTDLIGMCGGYGDGLPYPFWRTQRHPYWGTIQRDMAPFAERFVGDLSPARDWASTYAYADIWVECRISGFAPEPSETRLLAHRAGEAGFFASQRQDSDTVDIYSLSPLDLGAAIAGSANLWRPGTRASIAIPGYLENFMDQPLAIRGDAEYDLDDEDDYPIGIRPAARPRSKTTVISEDDILVFATLQSRCDPPVRRGLNWASDVVVWVRIKGDGDYIFTSDYSVAVPVTAQALRERINQAIAADVSVLRRRRGLA